MGIHVEQTKLDGVLLITPDHYADPRGFFLESWRQDHFAEAGIATEFVQDNHSRSAQGVLRGFHYQDMTAPMAKLVRCTFGSVWDVVVDLRLGSPTFGQWYAAELSADNFRQLLVPVGYGHAFLVLSEAAEVQYKCSTFYAPQSEGTVAWNDPEIAVPWPFPEPLVSARDGQGMTLAAYRERPAFHWQPSAATQSR